MRYIPKSVSLKAGRAMLLGQKHSPTIMFVGGVVGVVATTVMAARATLKLDDILETTNEKLSTAKELKETHHPDYSDTDYKQDVALVYVRSGLSIAKLYAPAVAVGVTSIACLTGSHIVLTRRNVALTAAYATVEKSFSEYRKRVEDELGSDKERELRFGSKTVSEKVVDEEGKTKKIVHSQFKDASMYAKIFGPGNQNFQDRPEYNLIFLRAQQNYWNDRLKAKGHVILNEVYSSLGLEHTSEGCVVGWVFGNGDNYIDFGFDDPNNAESFYDFMVSRDGAILLDFNVDGVVYDLIGKGKK